MQEYIQTLKQICLDAAQTLQAVSDGNQITYKSYEIDCGHLKIDYLDKEDITKADWFKDSFDGCPSNPTLYLIEKISGPNNKELIQLLKNYSASKIRGTSAIKKVPCLEAKYLYIGKVKNTFYGRVIQHLGFFTNSQTVGLQLFHWLNGKPMIIKFHAYHFPIEMANYMEVLEYELAKQFPPLIGKHK